MLYLVLDPRQKKQYFIRHWSVDLQEEMLQSVELVVRAWTCPDLKTSHMLTV